MIGSSSGKGSAPAGREETAAAAAGGAVKDEAVAEGVPQTAGGSVQEDLKGS